MTAGRLLSFLSLFFASAAACRSVGRSSLFFSPSALENHYHLSFFHFSFGRSLLLPQAEGEEHEAVPKAVVERPRQKAIHRGGLAVDVGHHLV